MGWSKAILTWPLRGLLGDGAPLSASVVARLKAGWQAEYDAWRTRSVADLEPAYLWVDGIYVKAGLEKDKAAMHRRLEPSPRRADQPVRRDVGRCSARP